MFCSTHASARPQTNTHTFLRTLPSPLLEQTTPPPLSRPRRSLVCQLVFLRRGVGLRFRERLMLCSRGRGFRGCRHGCRGGRRWRGLLLVGRGGGFGGRV